MRIVGASREKGQCHVCVRDELVTTVTVEFEPDERRPRAETVAEGPSVAFAYRDVIEVSVCRSCERVFRLAGNFRLHLASLETNGGAL